MKENFVSARMTQIAQIYTDFFNKKSVRIRTIRVIRVLKDRIDILDKDLYARNSRRI